MEDFRLKREAKPAPAKTGRLPRHKAGEWFIKGPLPGSWVSRAAGLPGRSLHVGLALWYLAGLERSRQVKPTWKVWALFGLSHDAGARGLAELEKAGLVEVKRAPGRCPVVTIVGEECPDGPPVETIASKSAANTVTVTGVNDAPEPDARRHAGAN